MGVEKNVIDANKLNKSNSGDLYRPPALRNQNNETIKKDLAETRELMTNGSSINIETNDLTSISPPTAANVSITTTTSISCNNSPIRRNENVIINNLATPTQQNSTYNSQQNQQQVDEQQKQPQRQQQARRERRPDRAVYIPRARRSQTTPPNTAKTQLQPPTQQQQQPTQLPVLIPTTTNDTSKSLSQQLPITLDDTTTDSVNQKPSSKAVEVGKFYNSSEVFENDCSNHSSAIINKKEKLNKENKESREQRREKRLLRKLSTVSTHHFQNYKNTDTNNTISNIAGGNEIANQAFIADAQQIESPLLKNDVNNFRKLNNNINNLSKGFNCDSSDEYMLNKEQKLSANPTAIRQFQFSEINPDNDTEFLNTSVVNTSESQFPVQTIEINCKTTANNTSNIDSIATANFIINYSNINTMPKPSAKTKSSKVNREVPSQTKLPNLRIENVASPIKCDVEEQELQRASKEINRSNRRIIKQTFISDVLQIPDYVNEEESEKLEVDVDVGDGNNESITKDPRTTIQTDTYTEDEEEEDDWENMFNDSGDCLDPKIMQELTASLGKCKIELPKMDYRAFLTKQSILNEEEFPHVLEVSNFPVEFKNQDLLMVFSQYKESGFDIKWVDDTHALAVFSSSRIAAEVLTMGHPFVVLKPLAEATIESRLKAKKCAASLQPYRPRPETCAALARRLVTGALGVRLKTAAAERENEKRVLREAKERKLLAAKQRDEVWDS